MTSVLRPYVLSRTVRATAGRISWGLGDQAVSSITNFAVGIVIIVHWKMYLWPLT